ncbi:MAG: hypothetical protein J2O49_11435 [Sciscionella sp.]|nr:hypothetical protein [Sciscionella sp.]
MSDGWHVDPLTLREVVDDRAELERRLVDAAPADRVWLLRVLGRLDDALTLGQRLLRERSTLNVSGVVACRARPPVAR